MQKVARRCQGHVSDFMKCQQGRTCLCIMKQITTTGLITPKPNVTKHHNQLQSLCIAISTKGLPELATNK